MDINEGRGKAHTDLQDSVTIALLIKVTLGFCGVCYLVCPALWIILDKVVLNLPLIYFLHEIEKCTFYSLLKRGK